MRATKKTKRAKAPPPRVSSIEDAISAAFGELQALGEELREWAGNIEEKFGGSDKHAQLEESADILEGLDEPTVPDTLKYLTVTIQDPTPTKRGRSRATRCSDECAVLGLCTDALEPMRDDTKHPLHGDASTLYDELETIIDEASQVEFPGMYG